MQYIIPVFRVGFNVDLFADLDEVDVHIEQVGHDLSVVTTEKVIVHQFFVDPALIESLFAE